MIRSILTVFVAIGATLVTCLSIAQAPPYYGSGSPWQITNVQLAGTYSVQTDTNSGTNCPWNQGGVSQITYLGTSNVQINVGPGPSNFQNNGTASLNGNATITFQWVGQSPPPAYLTLLVQNSAIWQCGSYFPTGTLSISGTGVNDGYNDPEKNPPLNQVAQGQQGISQGKYLIKVAVQNGMATVTLPNLSAAVSASYSSSGTANNPSMSAFVNVMATIWVQYDPRAVYISSSLSPTFHKGPNGAPVMNLPDINGTLTDDTVQPLDDSNGNPLEPYPGSSDKLTCTYSGSYSGNWSLGSTYHWFSSLKQDAFSDLLDPHLVPGIADFTQTYTPHDFSNTPSGVMPLEHIYLSLVDAGDGAKASANYYIRFHAPFENWQRTQTIVHPYPDCQTITYDQCLQATQAPSPYTNKVGDWNVVGPFKNGSNSPYPLPINYSSSYTAQTGVTGTIDFKNSAGLDSDLINYAFETNEGVTISGSVQVTKTISIQNIVVPPHTRMYIIWGVAYTEHDGVTDYYALDGFQGILQWYDDVPQLLPGNQQAVLIEYVTAPYDGP